MQLYFSVFFLIVFVSIFGFASSTNIATTRLTESPFTSSTTQSDGTANGSVAYSNNIIKTTSLDINLTAKKELVNVTIPNKTLPEKSRQKDSQVALSSTSSIIDDVLENVIPSSANNNISAQGLAGIDGTGGTQPTPNTGIDGTGGTQPTPNTGIDGTGEPDTQPIPDTGIDGTGGPQVIAVLGTLEPQGNRFIVNGVTFSTNNTTETIVDGKTTDTSALTDGQVVIINGSIDESNNGLAQQIIHTTQISGAITHITGQSITVLGQTVVLHDEIIFGGTATQFSDLQLGDTVNVSGFKLSNDDLSATRIERLESSEEDKLTGVISENNETDKTFSINQLTVNYDQIDSALLNNGMQVTIKGSVSEEDSTVLIADSIEIAPSVLDNAVEEVELEGFITELTGESNFKIGNIAIQTNLQTVYIGDTVSGLDINVKVEVEGKIDPKTNMLIASKIIFQVAGITSHGDRSSISSSTETFTWNDVNAKAYRLRIFQAGSDVFYDQVFEGNVTSVTITGLPENSTFFIVDLFTQQGDFWSRKIHRFYGSGTLPSAKLTSHKNDDVLKGSTDTFTWNTISNAEAYRLLIFDFVTGSSYYDKTFNEAENVTLNNLPTNEADITIELFTRHNGWWSSLSYNLKSAKLKENSILTSHTDGVPLTSSTQTFNWKDVDAEQYELRIIRPTLNGSFNVIESLTFDNSTTSATIHNLPTSNANVLVWLRTKHGGWSTKRYTFPGVGIVPEAELTSHSNNDVFSSSTSETFTWTEVPEAEAYQLTLRNPVVDYDIKFTEDYDSFITSASIPNLPKNSGVIKLTLSTKHNGYWSHKDYKLFGTGELPDAEITSHTYYQKIITPSTTITWNDTGADAYLIRISDTSVNPPVRLHEQAYGPGITSATIDDLPNNTRLRITIDTQHGNWWSGGKGVGTTVFTEYPKDSTK